MNVIAEAFKYYKKYWFIFLLCMLIGYTYIIIMLLFPQLTQLIVDAIFGSTTAYDVGDNMFAFLADGRLGPKGSMELLINLAIVFMGFVVTRHILMYIRWKLAHHFGLKCENYMRKDIFEKIVTQNPMILNRYNTGELLSIANTDASLLMNMFIMTIPFITDGILAIAISSYFLIDMHFLLALVPLAACPFLIIFTLQYRQKMVPLTDNIRSASADLNMVIQENINGVRIVRSYAAEEQEKRNSINATKIIKKVISNTQTNGPNIPYCLLQSIPLSFLHVSPSVLFWLFEIKFPSVNSSLSIFTLVT